MAQNSPPQTLAQWVSTNLEFTPHATDFVWTKALLERVGKEVPNVGRNKISAFIKGKGGYLDTKHCKATGKSETAIFRVRYRTASLVPLSAQSTPEPGDDVAPTIPQWFSANIEVTGNPDDLFPRCAAVNAAMAQVADVGEEAVLRLFKSKGLDLELLPRSKPDGKVTHTRVVVGGRWKTAPRDGDGAATLPSEEGTFDQFVTWFDKEFAISPGTTPCVKWKFLRTYCQRTHSISDEELEEFVHSRGGQLVSADDPANPQKCTMVRGIMWQAPPSSTNRLHLTCTDPEMSQGQPKDEAGEEVVEDEGKAEDDSDTEMFQTSKEAVRSYRDKGFRFKHTESELCRAMCCTSRPVKGPCGPCPALAKVRRDTSSEGQWYVDVITPHTDDCPHHTDFKVRGAWLHGCSRNHSDRVF